MAERARAESFGMRVDWSASVSWRDAATIEGLFSAADVPESAKNWANLDDHASGGLVKKDSADALRQFN
jgi:hypothetical protein